MADHSEEVLISIFDRRIERRTFGSTEKAPFYQEDSQTGMEVVGKIIQAHTPTKSVQWSIYMVMTLEVPAIGRFSVSIHLRHLGLVQCFFDPWQHHHTIMAYNMTI